MSTKLQATPSARILAWFFFVTTAANCGELFGEAQEVALAKKGKAKKAKKLMKKAKKMIKRAKKEFKKANKKEKGSNTKVDRQDVPPTSSFST